jgi:phage gp45-like
MAFNVHLGTIVGSEIIENMDGENPTRMLSAELSSAEDVQSIEHINQNGEQTNPLDDSTVIILEISSAWKIAIAVKDLVEPDAAVGRGEKKIYALDSSNNVVAWIYLKSDGSIRLDNGTGSLEITAAGDVKNNDGTDWAIQFTEMKTAFDALKSDLNNFITTKYNAHIHGGVTTGSGSTAATLTTGSASSADMANSKVDTVRLP